MWKIVVSIVFFILTPSLLILSSILLVNLSGEQVLGDSIQPNQPFAYAALPTSENVFAGSAILADKRPLILSNFLDQYHSPLKPYATDIVAQADQNNIDWRLLVAIAMQETTLCKTTLKVSPYNCWGYGIWGKKITTFSSFEDAIKTISLYFGKKKERGITTLDAIGAIYNPNDTSHWKEHVAGFMAEL